MDICQTMIADTIKDFAKPFSPPQVRCTVAGHEQESHLVGSPAPATSVVPPPAQSQLALYQPTQSLTTTVVPDLTL